MRRAGTEAGPWLALAQAEVHLGPHEPAAPLKVLCEFGGWKTVQRVRQCYQRADEGQLRKALEERRTARYRAQQAESGTTIPAVIRGLGTALPAQARTARNRC